MDTKGLRIGRLSETGCGDTDHDSLRGFNGTAGGMCNGVKNGLRRLGEGTKRGLDSQVRQIDSMPFAETRRRDHARATYE